MCAENPAELTDGERARLGITQKVPEGLWEALQELEADVELRQALGISMMEKYLTFKRSEKTAMNSMDKTTRFKWEVERY